MLKIKDNIELTDIYKFHMDFDTPYFFDTDYEKWKQSFEADIDGEGRVLFKELKTKAVYDEETIYAFFHYFGMTCFARHGKLFEKNNNTVAQHYYEKNDFCREGITRSYYKR